MSDRLTDNKMEAIKAVIKAAAAKEVDNEFGFIELAIELLQKESNRILYEEFAKRQVNLDKVK